MSEYILNDTGCLVARSHITGDIVCQEPGDDCDCLIVARVNTVPDDPTDAELEAAIARDWLAAQC